MSATVVQDTAQVSFGFWKTQYLSHLKLELGRSALTVTGYGTNLGYFQTWLEGNYGEATIDHLILPICRAYVMQMAERGLKPKTIQKAIAPIKGLVRYLADEGLVTNTHWLTRLRGPKVVERRADPLSMDEARRLLAAIPSYTVAGQRDRVLFHLFVETGLRIGEMLSLTVSDCRLDLPVLVVRHGKGDKDRAVPLTNEMADELRNYLDMIRPALIRRDSPPSVWLSNKGKTMAPTSLRDRLRYYAKLAGLDGRHVHPHQLRATFATRLDMAQVNVTVIQELMGHSDIKTTSHYVGVAGKEMRNAIQKIEPL